MRRKSTIKLDLDLVKQLEKLGHIGKTVENVIEELVSHTQICDKYWDDRE